MKDLLGGAVRRANISREVTTAQVIEAANLSIAWVLPNGRGDDARAVSLREGTLLILCLSGPAAQRIDERRSDLSSAIKARVPQSHLLRIQTKIVLQYPTL